MELKTPSEILEENPELKAVWNVRELGYLLMLKLVRGRKGHRTSYLNVNDVKAVYELVKIQ